MKSKITNKKKLPAKQISICDNNALTTENGTKESPDPGVNANKEQNSMVKKILVADDDPAIIDVLQLMLEAFGYEVYASADWKTIGDVNKICPDLILLDIFMSGVNGQNICKQLKKQSSTKHIPVIIISANKNIGEIALNACADDFIAKPFEMDKLLLKVEKHISV